MSNDYKHNVSGFLSIFNTRASKNQCKHARDVSSTLARRLIALALQKNTGCTEVIDSGTAKEQGPRSEATGSGMKGSISKLMGYVYQSIIENDQT